MTTAALHRTTSMAMTDRDVKRIQDLENYVAELQFAHRGEVFDVPSPLKSLLQQAVAIMAAGDSVGIVPLHKELTTQEAADLLGMSRPHLVKLLEGGQIPFKKVGTHRRIHLSDVRAYKERREQELEREIDEMADFLTLCGTYDN